MSSNKTVTDGEIQVIGLTGGIGTGKSTAAGHLKKKGLIHVDADEISRGMTVDGSRMVYVLGEIFGPDGEMGVSGVNVLKAEGCLDRKALASVVFADTVKKQRLDELMFGAITEEIDRQISDIKRTGWTEGISGILLDAPLLFEAGLDNRCDTVLLLTADTDIRIARVCVRDGATPEEVGARIRNQMSDDEKIQKADYVIDNSDTAEKLYEKLDTFFDTVVLR